MVTPLIATNIFWSPMFLSAAYRIAVSQGAHSLGFLFFAFLGSPRPAVTLKCKILPWFYTGFSTFFLATEYGVGGLLVQHFVSLLYLRWIYYGGPVLTLACVITGCIQGAHKASTIIRYVVSSLSQAAKYNTYKILARKTNLKPPLPL